MFEARQSITLVLLTFNAEQSTQPLQRNCASHWQCSVCNELMYSAAKQA